MYLKFLFPAAVKKLDDISEGGLETESSRLAGNLMNSVTTCMFQFILSFIVTKQCLGYVKGTNSFSLKEIKRYLPC